MHCAHNGYRKSASVLRNEAYNHIDMVVRESSSLCTERGNAMSVVMKRRTFLGSSLALGGFPFVVRSETKGFPSRSIRMVVPYPPGGGTDAFARTVAPAMSEILGQQIFIDNRPGGSSIIGATAVAHAPADGYTFLLGDMSTFATNRALFKKISYDSFTDFAPITLSARFGLMLVVHPSVPVKNLQELIALAKSKPELLSYGTPGVGTPHHLTMEMLMLRTGIKLNHVPYKGDGPAMQDLLSGQVPVLITSLASARQHMEADKVRALVSTGKERLRQAPQLPTVAESGFEGFDTWVWQGFAAPAKTPAPIIEQLNDAYAKATQTTAVRQRMEELGGELIPSSSQDMDRLMRREAEIWLPIIRKAGISQY